MMPRKLCILGATGSIGLSTLAIVRAQPQAFDVVALTAHRNVAQMRELCEEFQPQFAVMADEQAAQALRAELSTLRTQVLAGREALAEVAGNGASDTVMAAIVGGAGLVPTLAAVHAGKRVLLANKEALVMSGQLFIDAARASGAQILPVDSEHNAIFQCLPNDVQQQLGYCDLKAAGVHKILLTGSGGPFRELPLSELAQQTPAAACAHPNWDMGQKISVDSATMMNKGLEYIEARWLFNCSAEQIEVVLHPQSVIHSMVSFDDGSVLAQMGQPDMRTPIAHCLSYPERIQSGVAPLDFMQLNQLTFAAADAARYPCLALAMECCWLGQWATTALNAANEVAVAHFLAHDIGFTAIAELCQTVVAQLAPRYQDAALADIDAILALDAEARKTAEAAIQQGVAC